MAEEVIRAKEEEQPWGRVLVTGGMHWASNGRKDRPNNAASCDLAEPHILRSLCNVKITKIISSPGSNYAIVIDLHGNAHMFGKAPAPSLVKGSSGVISEHKPLLISPTSVGLPKGTSWITGATGRNHALLVDSIGGVWGVGINVTGQLGLAVCPEIESWTKINGPWAKADKVIQVSAGNTFSLFLTDKGKVYAAGSSECGQCGNGKTGLRLLKAGKMTYDVEVPPRQVQGLDEKKIVKIASGNQHSLAMDDEGHVWAWGFAGYVRLGLGDQVDRLVPTLVPSDQMLLQGRRIFTVDQLVCIRWNQLTRDSIVIDRLGLFYMAGKWKVSGDGSTGQPYTSYKLIQDLMGCKISKASSGGAGHFVLTPGQDGKTMSVAFGQGLLYGELGLGKNEPKNSTKPVEIEPLHGIDVIDVVGGSFFTLFLARPNAALSEIPRWPVHIKSPDICVVCNERTEKELLECEKCDYPYHLGCLTPSLESVPEEEWFCPNCEGEQSGVRDEEGAIDTGDVEEGAEAEDSSAPLGKGTPKPSVPKSTDSTPKAGVKRKGPQALSGNRGKKVK